MTDIIYIQKRRVDAILEHPNADKLAILKIGHFTVLHSREEAEKMRIGQLILHVPTDICIHPDKAVELGVDKYCRKVRYKNGEKAPCRVVAAKLRGVPSHGFIILDEPDDIEDWDDYYGVWKYEPPEIPMSLGGQVEREEHPQFPKYTKIKRIQYQAERWTEGLPVRVTEKIHGTNVRLGVVQVDGEWRYMVGSHNVIRRQYFNHKLDAELTQDKYWNMLSDKIMALLNDLCDGEKPVVVYGEMYGPGVQDLDYGENRPMLRVFDIMVDGEYMPWDIIRAKCELHMVTTVPLLYEGRFAWCLLDQYVEGQTTVCAGDLIKSRFKDREGIVITPLTETETFSGDRLIAKVVSAGYESRRGGTEYH